MRVWSKHGVFEVAYEPGRESCAKSIVVRHAGALKLEVKDPALIEHMLRLAVYDLLATQHN